MDFGVWSRRSSSESNSLMYCDKYAVLSEQTIGQTNPICAGDQRVRNAYVSKTSTLDITIMTSWSDQKKHFLLKYEGKISTLIYYINDDNSVTRQSL